ncbi:MAG: dodecin family protein [Sphingorhabdus sp.]
MSVARVTEIISSSTTGFEDAVSSGIARANTTLSGIQGAWVKDTKVSVTDGNITEWRVVLKITFILKD